MSDASGMAYRKGQFTINDDTIFELLQETGGAGARNDELWSKWRDGKDVSETQIHSFQNQIIGRTSELLRKGLLIAKKENYTGENGAVTQRSRYFLAPVKGVERRKLTDVLREENEKLLADLKELRTKYEVACRSIDRMELQIRNQNRMSA